jgi:3-hydroxyisobutyrate dehydrogenase-like beta-hydroxyacid dehydrogenase
MQPAIGFIGMGIMGMPMAANLLKAGFTLKVYNRTAAKAQPLVQAGATLAASPRELAQEVDLLLLMVTGPEAVQDVLWGRDGAFRELGPGKTLINMSTVSPRFSRELNSVLSGAGTTFIDAPVSGSKKAAEEKTLIILASGPQEAVAQVTPVLAALGKKVVYCGEAGQGSMMKMSINLLLGLMMAGLAEAVAFGRAGGLSPEALLEVVHAGPLSCGLFQLKTQMLLSGEFPPQFPLKHMTKDAKFIIDTAFETGAGAPLGHLLLHLYRRGLSHGLGEEDFAAIYRVLEAPPG